MTYYERAVGLAEQGLGKAQGAYSAAKAAAPAALAPTLAKMEAAVQSYSEPVVAKIREEGPKLMATAEAKVLDAREYAGKVKGEGLAQFQAKREEYLAKVDGLLAEMKASPEKLAPYVEKVKAAVDDAKAHVTALDFSPYVEQIATAWAALLAKASPAVESVQAYGQGSFEAAKTGYLKAHDALVADPRYSAALSKGAEVLGKAKDQPYVQKAETLAKPYVEMALANKFVAGLVEKGTPYLSAVVDHLTPPVED